MCGRLTVCAFCRPIGLTVCGPTRKPRDTNVVLVLVLGVVVSTKAFLFHNRSLSKFANRLVTTLSTIAPCRIFKLSRRGQRKGRTDGRGGRKDGREGKEASCPHGDCQKSGLFIFNHQHGRTSIQHRPKETKKTK